MRERGGRLFFHSLFFLIQSNVASIPNFGFLKGLILTIPGWGVGGGGLLRNKTKLQPNLLEVELWLSLAKVQLWSVEHDFEINTDLNIMT